MKFADWFRSAFRMKKTNRPARRARLSFDRLEDRVTPTTGVLSSGIWTINGTNGAESITVSNDANNYSFTSSSGVSGVASVAVNAVTKIIVNGNNGSDTIDVSGISTFGVTVNGGNDNDTITGTAFADVLDGGSGNDTIHAGAGNDTLTGGSGADMLFGEGGDDTYEIAGSDANGDIFSDSSGTADKIVNTGGTLTLVSFAPSAAATTYSGIETFDAAGQVVQGDNGANILDLSGFATATGLTTINTFNGTDYVDVSTSAAGVTVNAGNDNDTIIGTAFADVLDGGSGNDTIHAGAGNDTLTGGSGADMLFGEGGDDTYEIAGSDANGDIFSDSSGTADKIVNTGGTLTLVSFAPSAAATTYSGIETFDAAGQVVQGDNGANILDLSGFATATGLTTINTFNGTDYVDVSTSAAGVTVNAGNDNDTIIGTAFADVLNGDSGNDTIYGDPTQTFTLSSVGEVPNNAYPNGSISLQGFTVSGGAYTGDPVAATQLRSGAGRVSVNAAQVPSGFGINSNFIPDNVANEANSFNNQGDGGSFGVGSRSLDNAGNNEFIRFSLDPVNGQTYRAYSGSLTANFRAAGVSGANLLVVMYDGSTRVGAQQFSNLPNSQGQVLNFSNGTAFDRIEVYVLDTGPEAGDDLGDLNILSVTFNNATTGTGDDTITGGSGADMMYGQGGNDTYNIAGSDANGDTFSDTSGTDAIVNTGGTLTLVSFAPSAAATTYSGIETFDAAGQVVQGDNGANTLDLSGFTTATCLTTINTFNGTDYVDVSTSATGVTVNGGSDSDTLIGTAFADVLDGGSGNDTIHAGAGNDTLTGGSGADMLFGEGGDDTYEIAGSDANGDIFSDSSGTADKIVNTGGTLTLVSFAPSAAATTYSGIETFDAAGQVVQGDNGANTLDLSGFTTATGLTTINTFNGSDYVDVSTSATGVTVNAGNDNDTIIGTAFADVLDGEGGNDIIHAGAGNDTLTGGSGADDLYGENGNDIFIVSGSEMQGDFVSGGSGTNGVVNIGGTLTQDDFQPLGTAPAGTNNRYVGIQSYSGNGAGINGDNGANTLDFSLIGSLVNVTPNVTLFNGNDTVWTAASHSVVTNYDGGSNSDTINLVFTPAQLGAMSAADIATLYDFATSPTGKVLSPTSGTNVIASLQFSAQNFESATVQVLLDGKVYDITDCLFGIDNVVVMTTTSYTDPSGNNSLIIGTSGNDTINAGNGHDLIFALGGNDTIYGGSGNDCIFAGSGNDTLDGGDGVDMLDGGNNGDVYLWAAGDDRDVYADSGSGGTDDIQVVSGNLELPAVFDSTTNGIDKITGASSTTRIVGTGGDDTWNFAGLSTSSIEGVYLDNGNDTFTGTSGNDVVYGQNGNDVLNGGGGNDTLNGGTGADTLNGNDGNDTLDGGDGVDILDGGNNGDVYLWAAGDDRDVYADSGSGGTDDIQVVSGNLELPAAFDSTTNGIDKITGASSTTRIVGTGGDDTWNFAGLSTSSIEGVYLDNGNDTFTGTSGNDVVYGQNGYDVLNGGGGNDTLNGGTGADTLNGNDGNDTLDGGDGVDILDGGNNGDVYLWAAGDDRDVYADSGSGGTDDIQVVSGNLELPAAFDSTTNGIDKITGTGSTEILGTGGDDVWDFSGLTTSGIAAIKLDNGNDTFTGTSGNDVVYGQNGNDVLNGGGGNDTLNGGTGADTLNGDDGNDTLDGGDGVDILDGGNNGDVYLWAAGDDRDVYADSGSGGTDDIQVVSGNLELPAAFDSTTNGIDKITGTGSTEILGTGGDDVWDFSGLTTSGIAAIKLDNGNDTFTGTSGNDVVYGQNGNDVLNGGGGNDTLNGGTGADTLNGDDGNDTLDGGDGVDILDGGNNGDVYLWAAGDDRDVYADSGSGGTDDIQVVSGNLELPAAFDSPTNGIDKITGTGSTEIVGTGGDDVWDFSGLTTSGIAAVKLDNGNDTFTGTGGNDVVYGQNGNDVLNGGGGNDELNGGTGADQLDGGDGNDILDGGVGNDILTGGANTDTFVFTDGVDTITDFRQSGNDVIDVTAFGLADFNALLALMSDDGTDTTIDFGGGKKLKILGRITSYFTASMFIL